MKIAISGQMCSGKTTIAKCICEINPEYNIHSFGGKIKELARDLFNMDKTKDRSLLINIANKMKDIDPDVWIKYILKECSHEKNCVIDDLRFANELEYLKNDPNDLWYFIVLQIPKEVRINRIKELYPNNFEDHLKNMNDISERGLIDFPIERTLYIANDAKENIKEKINDFIRFRK